MVYLIEIRKLASPCENIALYNPRYTTSYESRMISRFQIVFNANGWVTKLVTNEQKAMCQTLPNFEILKKGHGPLTRYVKLRVAHFTANRRLSLLLFMAQNFDQSPDNYTTDIDSDTGSVVNLSLCGEFRITMLTVIYIKTNYHFKCKKKN